jgi:hypothetical protein
MEEINILFGNRTRGLPVCSIVPQPSTGASYLNIANLPCHIKNKNRGRNEHAKDLK